ncbi:MAG: HYR domain-containing protein, partial [Saprospiraceae bacterium]
GYSVTVTNGLGTVFIIGNTCAYPNPVITSDLTQPFCVNSDPVLLTGTPGDANIVSAVFTVDGVVATEFDPNAAGLGQHEIVYTVDGGMPKAFGPNDPGCVQPVRVLVNVVNTPGTLVCNDLVNISLDANCFAELMPDDVVEGAYGCYGDYLVEIDRTLPYGNGPWTTAVLGPLDVGKTYQYRVTHLGSNNHCWGNVKIEDKLAPVLTCTPLVIPCTGPQVTPLYLQNVLGLAGAFPAVFEACCLQSLTWIDTQVDGDCATLTDRIITRKWTATDCSGNVNTCEQIITVQLPTLADVVLPPDYDDIDEDAFDCIDGQYPTPAWIEAQPDPNNPGGHLQGWPYVFGLPVGCTIGWTYYDYVLDVCDGTYKIRREWTIIDWCLGDGFEHDQIIKVLDDEKPTIACPAPVTASTNPINCCATVNLPDVIIDDNCSHIVSLTGMIVTFDLYNPNEQTGMIPLVGSLGNFQGNNFWDFDTLGVFGNTPCLPLGTHQVTYVAEDDCGNTTACTFTLTVVDYAPPFPACQEFTTVSIGIDDPNDCYEPADGCSDAGITWVPATSFDSGSYDNCGNIFLTVQRMAPYSDCIESLNKVNGHPDCSDGIQDFVTEYDIATQENDSIKFYCCEVGNDPQMIVL